MGYRLLLALVILVLSCQAVSADSLVSQGQFDLVGMTGIPLPNDSTNAFFLFGRPEISNSGQVVFGASTLRNDFTFGSEIWSWKDGQLTSVVHSNQESPGISGVLFDSFSGPTLNSQGEIAFSAQLKGSGVTANNDRGVWIARNGSVELVAREGQVVDGETVDNPLLLSAPYATLGEEGTLYFLAGPSSSLWRFNDTNGLKLIARQGDVAPGTNPPISFGQFSPPIMNASGQTVFETGALETGQGIWKVGSGGEVHPVLRTGGSVPDLGASAVIEFFTTGPSASINSAGDISVAATVRTGPSEYVEVILSNEGGSEFHPVFDSRMAPIEGASDLRFQNIGTTLANDKGSYLLNAFMSGNINSSNDTGLWIFDAVQGLRLVVREGEMAPGLGSNIFFGNIDLRPQVDFNDLGQTLFRNTLTGSGVAPGTAESIWLADADGPPKLLLRQGDVVEVMPGFSKTVLDFYFPNIKNDINVVPSALNSRGEAVIQVFFTDNSQAILVVPELSSGFYVLLLICSLALRHRITLSNLR